MAVAEGASEEPSDTGAYPPAVSLSESTPEMPSGLVLSSVATVNTTTSDRKVLLYYSDFSATEFAEDLVATGLFTADHIDTRLMNSQPPSLDELSAYDCVITWTNKTPPNAVAQGDRLKAYVEAGGRVVLAAFAITPTRYLYGLKGGIMEDGFNPLDPTATSMRIFPRTLNFSTAQTDHPILSGVSDFQYGGGSANARVTLDEGATLVARDNRGVPLIATNASAQVIAFNLYPQYFAKSPGVFRAMANACAFEDAEEPAEEFITVDAGEPVAGLEGQTVTFDASRSSHPRGGALTFSWDFGDGHTGSGPRPTHTYEDNDDYVVKLTVTDEKGVSGTAATASKIENVPPTVEAGEGTVLHSGKGFVLNGSFSDPGPKDALWSYDISWGDGTGEPGHLTDQTEPIAADHTFCAVGTYRVNLSVTDKDGGSSSDALEVAVEALPVSVLIKPGDDGEGGDGAEAAGEVEQEEEHEDGAHGAHGNGNGHAYGQANGHTNKSRMGNGGGVLPVALLTDDGFDAADVDPETVLLGNGDEAETPVKRRPNGTLMAALEDVDRDGDLDLMLHFSRTALKENGDLTASTEELLLRGGLRDDCTQFAGTGAL